MKHLATNGFLVLTVSGLICKIIGAFFRLPLTYILGVEGIGVFQLIMGVYSFVLILSSGGISVTLSKLISSARAKGEYGKIKWYIYVSISYSVVISFVLGLLFLFFSKQIAVFQHSETAGNTYKIFLVLLLFSSLVNLFRGIYQGFENMTPTAISQIVEQVCKFVFGVVFAYMFASRSLEGGVFGAFLGILIGEVLAFVYLVIAKKHFNLNMKKLKRGKRKEFFSYFVPATLGISISSFVHFFDSLVVVKRLNIAGFSSLQATTLYGIQSGVVGALLNIPIIISTSLSTYILPKLSFRNSSSKDDGVELKKNFVHLWYFILPITFGILAISLPLYQVLYPFFDRNMFVYAVRLTAIGSASTIFLAVMQYLTSILQSKGEFRFVFCSLFVGGILKMLCTIFLCSIKSINILGVAIGNVVFSFVVVLMCLLRLKQKSLASIDEFFIPLLSSLVMLVVTSFTSSLLGFAPITNMIICVMLGAVIYLSLTFPLLKEFKKDFFRRKKLGRTSE